MKAQKEKGIVEVSGVHRGTIEGVVIVNGRPQIERADMPLAFSFDSIEELKCFCEATKGKGQNQH